MTRSVSAEIVQKYEHSPFEETTILLSEGALAEQHIAEFVGEIDLPIDHFRWQPVAGGRAWVNFRGIFAHLG